jgi:CO/xanthine dehydrogenase Mo-binding subunit
MNDTNTPQPQVGRRVDRLESRSKVTGTADYTHNVVLPRMLHAKVVRSAHAHARIVSIDTSAAAAMPGVFKVVTAADVLKIIPDPHYGPAFHDQPILAIEKVRHIGEPVAVVLADDVHVAEAAAGLVNVEYEVLPAVFDEVKAANDTSILVHDVLKPAGTFPDLKHLAGRKGTNVALDYRLRHGDVDQAFATAARVFDHTFRTQQVMHVPLEPMISIAEPHDGGMIIHTASQSPSFVRLEIARLLGWPENRVQVKTRLLGGGFGAKLYIKLEALAVAMALIARRPVRYALTMEEQFYTTTKHATTFRIRTAVDANGRITGRHCEVYWNGGAYADIGPRVTQKSGFTAGGPYDIPNLHIDSYQVYTHLPPAGAFRGFGITQVVWGYESQADLIARELGMDPIAFRRLNLLENGRPHGTGTVLKDAGLALVLDRVASRMQWDKPLDRGTSKTLRRGRGVGLGFKALVAPTTSVATINLAADGSCTLLISTVDMGQGSDTAMSIIAAEVLGIPAESMRVVHPDTDVTPYDMATLGSRSTFSMGNAVRLAAQDLVEKVRALAAEMGMPYEGVAGVSTLLKKKFGMQAGTIVGTGSFIPSYQSPGADGRSPDITPNWMVGGTGVEIEVDTGTGHFRILRIENVVDCGTPINPKVVESQITGAAIQQLGATFLEKMEFDAEGQLRNASFSEYKIPGILDIPHEIGCDAVESRQATGPFGAKGIGESGCFGVASAVAEAIHDAVGVRITSLPITPEAVFRALAEQRGEPLAH